MKLGKNWSDVVVISDNNLVDIEIFSFGTQQRMK